MNMTDFREITQGFYVAPQLDEADIARATHLGFRTLINNRPDGEETGQPTARSLQKLAMAQGMAYYHLPVRGFQITDDAAVSAFEWALERFDEPVLAFCKSGTRSAMLWAQALAGRHDVDVILRLTAEAGLDLEILRDELEERMAQSGRQVQAA